MQLVLTLNLIETPFDAFEISCICKYYGKWSICAVHVVLCMKKLHFISLNWPKEIYYCGIYVLS